MTQYRDFGRTGVKVSPLCLGTMMFGARGNPDHADSVRIIHHALDSGINSVDTADVHSAGESATILSGRYRQGAGQPDSSRAARQAGRFDKIVPPGVNLSPREAGYTRRTSPTRP